MATTAASFVPEDVMKLFAQSFSSGVGAAEAGARIGLARQAQAQEFSLGTQKLALQSQELQLQENDNAAKIALQRENIAADSALKGQQINLQHQELAKNFLLKEHQMEQDKLNFAEKIKAAKAAEENERLKIATSVHQVEEANKIERAKLDIEKEKVKSGIDYRELGRLKDEQDKSQAVQFRKMTFLAQSLEEVRKEAKEPYSGLTKKEFQRKDGSDDEDKMYELAKARTNRLMDSTGGSVQSYSNEDKEKLKPQPKEEKFKPSGSLLVDVATADKMTKAMEGKKPGDTVVIDGKKYRVK